MPARVVPRLGVERVVGQGVGEIDQRVGRADRGRQGAKGLDMGGFDMGHRRFSRTCFGGP
jgi:hypothetical protein